MTAPTAQNLVINFNPIDYSNSPLSPTYLFIFSAENIGYFDEDGDSLWASSYNGEEIFAGDSMIIYGSSFVQTGSINIYFENVKGEGGSFTITTNYINIAPEGIDGNVTAQEDRPYYFKPSEFKFTDANNESLREIIISSLPMGGLSLFGAAVSVGQHIAYSSISHLSWTPPANRNGQDADTFEFQIVDSGGKWNGGQDTDQTSNTMILNVTPVSDAPTGADLTLAIEESGTRVFSVSDFTFDDIDGDNFAGIKIGYISNNGYLTLNGNTIASGQYVGVDELGQLTWHGDENTFGPNRVGFNFELLDDGGIVDDGADTSITYSARFNIVGTPDKPVTSNSGISLVEDQTFRFENFRFPFLDPDGDSLSQVVFTDIPDGARMFLHGVRVKENEPVSIVDLTAGSVTFVGPANFSGSEPAILKFRVVDDSASRLQSDEATLSITYAPMEDRPIAANDRFKINEGATALLDVLANDSDPDGDALLIKHAEVFSGDATVSIVAGKLRVKWSGRDLQAGEKETVIVNYAVTDGSNTDDALAVITVNGVTKMGADIKGNANANTLIGTALGERIFGLAGADKLLAKGGDDFLYGGAGNDRLTGGSGNDTFVFDTKSGKDVITDFGSTGETDRIDLRAIDEITNYKDLTRNHLIYKDGDAIITISKTDMITIADVLKGELFSANFLL